MSVVSGSIWVLTDGPRIVDFEQPRALYQNVFDDAAREALVNNIAGHFGGVKSAEIRARQRESTFLEPRSIEY